MFRTSDLRSFHQQSSLNPLFSFFLPSLPLSPLSFNSEPRPWYCTVAEVGSCSLGSRICPLPVRTLRYLFCWDMGLVAAVVADHAVSTLR